MEESAAPPLTAAPPAATMQAVPDTMQALPTLAAQLSSLYAAREPLKMSLDVIEKEIDRVELLAHQAMVNAGIGSFTTASAEFALKPRIVFNATDWSELHAHIQRTGEFDLLKRALSTTALRERGPDNLPPGVMQAAFDVFTFKARKP